MKDQNESTETVTPLVESDALFCLKGLLGGHGVWTPELEREIAEWAAKQCEVVGMKHQQVEGTYPAGKKAGAFECRDIFQQNVALTAGSAGNGEERIVVPDMDDFLRWITHPQIERCDGSGRVFAEDIPKLIREYNASVCKTQAQFNT